MQFRWPVLLVSLATLAIACNSNPLRNYERQAAPDFLFQPQMFHFQCGWSRWPGMPIPPRGVVAIFPQAPYAYTRPDTLTLARTDVPALTIATDPANGLRISVWGRSKEQWGLWLCAGGEGNSEAEARGFLSKVSMTRQGSLVTLSESGGGFGPGGGGLGPSGYVGPRGEMAVDGPADAPITVYNSYGAVRVEDMSGPVRVSAAHGRVTILNTTGRVDANGYIADYAGSEGTVALSADTESDIKLTNTTFEGVLSADAQRELRVLVPRGFKSRIEATVNRPGNFICRADICSGMKRGRENGWFKFTYTGDGGASSEGIHLHSEQLTVVIDNVK